MAVTLTEKAAIHVRGQIEKGKGMGLRLGVRKGGCTGFSYAFDFAEKVLDTDVCFESHGVKILVDRESLPMLDGSVLDYAQVGLNRVFKFDNPNVKDQCGCGESFSV